VTLRDAHNDADREGQFRRRGVHFTPWCCVAARATPRAHKCASLVDPSPPVAHIPSRISRVRLAIEVSIAGNASKQAFPNACG
jgi:hypothetical protein